jgi:hypothetical protein
MYEMQQANSYDNYKKNTSEGQKNSVSPHYGNGWAARFPTKMAVTAPKVVFKWSLEYTFFTKFKKEKCTSYLIKYATHCLQIWPIVFHFFYAYTVSIRNS